MESANVGNLTVADTDHWRAVLAVLALTRVVTAWLLPTGAREALVAEPLLAAESWLLLLLSSTSCERFLSCIIEDRFLASCVEIIPLIIVEFLAFEVVFNLINLDIVSDIFGDFDVFLDGCWSISSLL